ncbi:MAG: RrF2 family transcriptional regulator [Fastidiosipilaceae bacterium]|jgi:Rrf2 family iron-sulfur cluster assembly transcriptional regulator|nr:Rrf2 family transcriptional regulator [Clostridiaceae bacterium]
MKISTKGRYAVRVMLDMAVHTESEYMPLRLVASRQDISEKYMEAIAGMLVKDNLLYSVRGKGGGYKLARDPKDYTILEIIESVEGPLAPVVCLMPEAEACDREGECFALPLWKGLYEEIKTYLSNVTLEDLVERKLDGSLELDKTTKFDL